MYDSLQDYGAKGKGTDLLNLNINEELNLN